MGKQNLEHGLPQTTTLPKPKAIAVSEAAVLSVEDNAPSETATVFHCAPPRLLVSTVAALEAVSSSGIPPND